jgi:hypothetical protein
MKDPVKVAERQIKELSRLLAQRVDPNTCAPDTAGALGADGTINVSRDTQYTHTQHRLVFCECQDWPSKLEADQEWCRDWQTTSDRFYSRPYNFDTNGQF